MKKVFGTLDNKVFYLMTNKFHLNSVSFSFTFPLTTLNSTYLNLLEEILKDHIKNEIYHYPIKSYIQTLKKDHMLILIIYFQYPRHPFLNPNNTLFKVIVNLFENIICCDNTYLIKRFDTSKKRSIEKIIMSERDIKTIATRNCFKALNKNYVSLYGKKSVFSNTNKCDFIEWFVNFISNYEIPKQSFLVGDFEPTIEDIIKKILPNSKSLNPDEFVHKRKATIIDRPIVINRKIKSKIGFLVIALKVDNPDCYRNFSFKLLSEYLGGGGYSLLFNKIREELKLVYQITSTCNPSEGEIIISAKVVKWNLEEVIRRIDEEILLLQAQKINKSILYATLSAVKLNESRILDRPLSLTRGFINALTDVNENNENHLNFEDFNKLIKNIRKIVTVTVSEG